MEQHNTQVPESVTSGMGEGEQIQALAETSSFDLAREILHLRAINAELLEALQALRNAADGVKFVALKPQIYTDACTAQHAQRLLASIDRADAAIKRATA